MVSKEEPNDSKNSFKYFIGYNDDAIRPLCINLLQMIGYPEALKVTWQCTLRSVINNYLKSPTKYGKKVKNLLNIKFVSEPVYGDNDKCKVKIKIYDGNVNTNFQDKRIPKEKAPCKCFQ